MPTNEDQKTFPFFRALIPPLDPSFTASETETPPPSPSEVQTRFSFMADTDATDRKQKSATP